jgi:hypothetical protein
MLYCPSRSPPRASKRLLGNAIRSSRLFAASRISRRLHACRSKELARVALTVEARVLFSKLAQEATHVALAGGAGIFGAEHVRAETADALRATLTARLLIIAGTPVGRASIQTAGLRFRGRKAEAHALRTDDLAGSGSTEALGAEIPSGRAGDGSDASVADAGRTLVRTVAVGDALDADLVVDAITRNIAAMAAVAVGISTASLAQAAPGQTTAAAIDVALIPVLLAVAARVDAGPLRSDCLTAGAPSAADALGAHLVHPALGLRGAGAAVAAPAVPALAIGAVAAPLTVGAPGADGAPAVDIALVAVALVVFALGHALAIRPAALARRALIVGQAVHADLGAADPLAEWLLGGLAAVVEGAALGADVVDTEGGSRL